MVAELATGMAATALLIGCAGCATEPAEAKNHLVRTVAAPDAAAAAIKGSSPNELGPVPVLAYGRVTREPGRADTIDSARLRSDLEWLATEGYTPVLARDYVDGRLDLPAGRHPVVLTFDARDPAELVGLGPTGTPEPGSTADTLLSVARLHPDFTPVATVFTPSTPFTAAAGRSRRALRWLEQHGFEVADGLGSERGTTGPGAPGTPNRRRAAATAAHSAPAGPAETAARYRGVFLADGGLAPSPYCVEFDQRAIPRARLTPLPAGRGATAGLAQLTGQPSERYTSDGDASRLSFPRPAGRCLAPAYRSLAAAY